MHRFPAVLLLATLLVAPSVRAADEIHWTLTGPTSVTVDWRGSVATLRYGTTSLYGLTATGVTPSPLPFSSSGPFWEANINGLQPATVYHYSVAGGPDHLFHTLPATPTTFTVFVEGDIGDTSNYERVGPVQSLIAAGGPAFVLALGDLTYGNVNGQAAVDNHFNNVMKWSQDAAYMPGWGNHEWDESTDDFRNYKGRFGFPNPQTSPGAPSAGCCGEDWYWFDYGNVRFISYPEPFSGAWSDWMTQAGAVMDAAQSNRAISFIVTFGHRPAYSSGWHAGDPELAGYMNTLGASHSKYVLNLNGHSHNYERSYPQSGVTHVTVGIGGSTLEEASGSCLYAGGCPAPSWSAYRAFHHGALRLTISPTSIRGDAICGPAGDSGSNKNDITCTLGAVFDSFGINAVAAVPPGSETGPRLAFRSITPNPTAAGVEIAYSLPEATPVRLELVDLSGRLILGRDLGSPGPGFHVANLPSQTVPAPGIYWLRLSQSGRSVSSKVTFTH
jgi:hypothetical protein